MGTRPRLLLSVVAALLSTGVGAWGISQDDDTLAFLGLLGLALVLIASWVASNRQNSLPESVDDDPEKLSSTHDASPPPAPATGATSTPASDPKQHQAEQGIRAALEDDRVALAYQPVFDLTTGLMVAVEALLRLRDADGVVKSPYEVIGVAEKSGLITDIGWRVLQLAATQGGVWRDQYGVIVPVAVNVSAAQLGSSDFPTDVLAAVERAGLPPHALTLELTETVMLGGRSPGSEQLRDLRTAGFELAIDDFGTGYASLSYLHELPASALKIDQTFVSGLPDDRRSVAIVAGVVALARHCGIACIAEGIETEAQREHLVGLGVLGQGFLLGRPGDAKAIGELIEQGRADLPVSPEPASAGSSSDSPLDAATGAFWRDPGMKELDREVARAQRSATSLVLAFVRLGLDESVERSSANTLMVEVASALRSRLRPYDLVVRFGDDELVCAVAATPLAEIDQRLTDVADEIQQLSGHPTLHVGSAQMETGETLQSLVARIHVGFRDRGLASTLGAPTRP